MFMYLVRRAPVHGVTYYIEGMDLLRLLQRVVNEKKARTATVGEGEGNLLKPWRLKTADAWLGRAVKLPKNQENYLIVGGRLIKRSRDQYINDEGPAWRAGHEGALPLSNPGATAVQAGPAPNNLMSVRLRNYLKKGDSVTLLLDPATHKLSRLELSTSLDKDSVSMTTDLTTAPNGPSYPSLTTIKAPAKNLEIRISSYELQKS